MNEEYCCWAEKRLFLSDTDTNIQGCSNGIFWERNTLNIQLKETKRVEKKASKPSMELFSGVI